MKPWIKNSLISLHKLSCLHRRILPSLFRLSAKGLYLGSNVSLPWTDILSFYVGKHVAIHHDCDITIKQLTSEPPHLEIGDGTALGDTSRIFCGKRVVIGKNCLISHNVFISDSEHVFSKEVPPPVSGLRFVAEVSIGNNCFIGRNVTVLPGTCLGDGCIVGANAILKGYYAANSKIVSPLAKVL